MFVRLTRNVVLQDGSAPEGGGHGVWEASRRPSVDGGRLTHVVQFYRGDHAAERVQAETAEAMRRAALAADVRLVAVPLAGEEAAMPPGFHLSRPLERDVRECRSFLVPRRLPFLFDILAAGAEAAQGEGWVIFTNSDICPRPLFHGAVRSLLGAGADSLVINRRTVGELASYGAHPELAALEVGVRHDGFDCFVFPAAWVAKFAASDICVGVPLVGRALLYNMVARASRLVILRDAALTYHYGDDRSWSDPRLNDYRLHNRAALALTMYHLLSVPDHRRRLSDFLPAYGERLDVPGWEAVLSHANAGGAFGPSKRR